MHNGATQANEGVCSWFLFSMLRSGRKEAWEEEGKGLQRKEIVNFYIESDDSKDIIKSIGSSLRQGKKLDT
jgi:hypothetical protein